MKERLLRWLFVLTALGVGTLGLWVLKEYYPTHRDFFPRCILHEVTGLYCPGCGTTRAVRSLLCGDFDKALRYNPLFTLSMPFLLWWMYREILWVKYHIPRPAWIMSQRFALIVAVAMIAYCILRNLPWPPFCFLAPLPD